MPLSDFPRIPVFRAPVSWLLVAVAIALKLVVNLEWRPPEPEREALHRLGAVVPQVDSLDPELTGLFALWDGAWWRIAASPLHHVNVLSLALAATLFLALGFLLEPRWGSLRFLAVWGATSLAGFAVAYCVQETPLGLLTGAFGLLFAAGAVRRAADEEPLVPGWFVPAALIVLVVVAALSSLGELHVPYIAWLTAAATGWGIGREFRGTNGRFGPFATGVLPWLLAAGVWGAAHPVWFGTYPWHKARGEADADAKERLLAKAITTDPALIGPRIELAELQARRNAVHRGWQTILEALKVHSRDRRTADAARKLWTQLPTPADRRVALETLRNEFGGEADFQIRSLGIEPAAAADELADAEARNSTASKPDPENAYRLDQKIELSPTLDGAPELAPRDLTLPPPDTDRPDSAAEGRGV